MSTNGKTLKFRAAKLKGILISLTALFECKIIVYLTR